MKRYEGFLRPGAGKPHWPGRIWVVGVELTDYKATESGHLRSTSLHRWYTSRLDFDGPRCVSRSHLSGCAAGDFWSAFLAQEAPKGSLWVVSPRALMAWQTLELWEKIETGNVCVLPVGRVGSTLMQSGRMIRSPGLLLTGDPPTAGYLIHGESELSFTWVCAGNYGIQGLSAGVDCRIESEELASRLLSVLRLLCDHQLGGLGITAGGIAKSGWLNSYNGSPLYVSSGRLGDTLETRAVAGGILFARPTGDKPVTAYAVDCRSMYPHICTHYSQGVDMLESDLEGHRADSAVRACPLATIAEVEVECNQPRYPLRSGREVTYPTGHFTTVLCGPELQEGLKHGHVKRVHRCHTYRLGCPLADYQRRVWTARQRCDSGEYPGAAGFIKRLGVSLIGKFAQRSEVWGEVTPELNDPLWGSWTNIESDGTTREMRARAGIVEAQIGHELCSHAIMSIALWVWSWGRVKLWRWISLAGIDSVIYADTDGILLLRAGYDRLKGTISESAGSWGCLRLVCGPTPCVVRGLKNYVLGNKIVQAGYPKNQRESMCAYGDSAWYRLPWNEMRDPGQGGSWIERMR